MTIHVNIGEAKTRLSELLRAIRSGERVIIQRDGMPEAELVPAEQGQSLTREQIAARRRSAVGMFSQAYSGCDTSLEALKADRGERAGRLDRALGAAD
jgi:antitoxin (DNA-binding transcriptional repressor) of toxin-antitoxin stability system